MVATPPVTVEVPNDVVPFVKVTVPVTLLGNVSVKVTLAPGSDGLTEEVRVEVVVALDTVCVVVPTAVV